MHDRQGDLELRSATVQTQVYSVHGHMRACKQIASTRRDEEDIFRFWSTPMLSRCYHAPGGNAGSQHRTRSGQVFLRSRRVGITMRDRARAATGKRSEL